MSDKNLLEIQSQLFQIINGEILIDKAIRINSICSTQSSMGRIKLGN